MSYPRGIHLAFIPIYIEDKEFESFELYLVNNTSYSFDYTLELKIGNQTFINFEGDLPCPGFVDMDIIAMEEFNQPVKLNATFHYKQLFKTNITLKPINLFSKSLHIDVLEEEGFRRPLLLQTEIDSRSNPKQNNETIHPKPSTTLTPINTDELRESMLSKKFKLMASV